MHGQQQPYPFQHYPQQPYLQQPPKKKRAGLIIMAVIGALVLVGGGVTAVVLVTKDEKPAAKQEAEPPDDDILEERTTTEAVKYGELTVIDACTLMPVAVLEETGFGDAAHGGHSQTYVQKSVSAAEATVKDSSNGISSCRYDVQKPDRIDFLALTVHQAPFNDPLPARLIRDDIEITVGGLRAFTKKAENRNPTTSTRGSTARMAGQRHT